MSKVTHIDRGIYYALDCAHVLNGFDVEWVLKKGDEVDCHVCADNETQVNAALLVELKIVRELIMELDEGPFMAVADRITELEAE